jgi:citrate lyase subunit beta/citryl-CoA lyase
VSTTDHDTGTRVPMVPLRSVLFVASTEPEQIRAALASGADAVIIDMEEPQTPMNESVRERARAIVREVLSAAPVAGTVGAPRILCRVQAPRTGQMLKDLRAILHPALYGVVVPKSLGPDDIVAADAVLANAEAEAGLPAGRVVLYPILETATALRRAYDIAMASPRVAHLGGAISRFGDIHQAVGYRWTPESRETFVLRSNVLIDARAAGIRYPISGMWGGAVADVEGFRRFALELRDLGYFGMMISYAEHVELCREVFTPAPDEVAYWKDLVRLGDEAARTGVGPILYGDPGAGEGHVVHGAHVESARLNLEWATALGVA